jgi:hypothetical protein
MKIDCGFNDAQKLPKHCIGNGVKKERERQKEREQGKL